MSADLVLPIPVLVVKEEEEGLEAQDAPPTNRGVNNRNNRAKKEKTILAMIFRTIESLLNGNLQPSFQHPLGLGLCIKRLLQGRVERVLSVIYSPSGSSMSLGSTGCSYFHRLIVLVLSGIYWEWVG